MKLVIPNIVWHGERERIMTLAIHPTQNLLLTGGSDSRIEEEDNTNEDVGVIKMWTLIENSSKMVEYAGSLNSGHNKPVNCLKFSHDGKYFASGSDDYTIIIWSQQMKQTFGQSEMKLQWWRHAIFTGHSKEIYDLSWSRNGVFLISGGLDKNVILWNTKRGKQQQTLDGHQSYVQGVVMDPRMKSIISLSQDRTARVWKISKTAKKTLNSAQFYTQNVVRKLDVTNKTEVQTQQDDKKSHGMFLGETSLFTFVRRPDWSPDGSCFILPSAEFWVEDKPILGAYGFLRQSPTVPCFFLPTTKPAVVVRFSQKYFARNPEVTTPLIDLPYKMIFAIATTDSLFVYTTESQTPIGIFGNLHYASITDISFRGANLIAISSCDGFCSFVQIEDTYFGQELSTDQLPDYVKSLYQIQMETEEPQQQKEQEIVLEQRVEYKETVDGKKKKMIIPKTIMNQPVEKQ